MTKGWFRESARHSLASRGIKTNVDPITPIHDSVFKTKSEIGKDYQQCHCGTWFKKDGTTECSSCRSIREGLGLPLPEFTRTKTSFDNGASYNYYVSNNEVANANYSIESDDERGKHIKIGFIGVDPSYQSHGIGSDFLYEINSIQFNTNLPVYLDAVPPERWRHMENDTMDEWHGIRDQLVKFYESHGFVTCDTRDDIITMVK